MSTSSRRRAKCCTVQLPRQCGGEQGAVGAQVPGLGRGTLWRLRRTKAPGLAGGAGFTLLEVLVAVAIVAVALVTFMGLHLRSLDATIRAQDLTMGVLLAQGRLASLPEFPDPGEEQGTFEGPELERFHWETAVTEQILEAPPDGGQQVTIRHLVVAVLWADGQQTRRYTLEAYRVR